MLDQKYHIHPQNPNLVQATAHGSKKETARPCKEVAPDKTTRPGCLSLSFARPLQTLRVTAAVWSVLETKTEWLQAAYDGCGHSADTIKTHFYSFPQSHNLGCLFFMMVEGGAVFLGDVLNPPILQRSPRALHLFSYTNSIRALITVH